MKMEMLRLGSSSKTGELQIQIGSSLLAATELNLIARQLDLRVGLCILLEKYANDEDMGDVLEEAVLIPDPELVVTKQGTMLEITSRDTVLIEQKSDINDVAGMVFEFLTFANSPSLLAFCEVVGRNSAPKLT